MAVFGDLNEVKLLGNITHDLELRKTPNGNSVTSFSIATNRRIRVGDDWEDAAEFHNIVVWGNDAEYLNQKARKGTRVYVGGRLQTRSWEDQEGVKKYKTEVVADKVILLDRYERGSSEGFSAPSKQNTKDKTMEKDKVKNKASDKSSSKKEDTIDPDDLPF